MNRIFGTSLLFTAQLIAATAVTAATAAVILFPGKYPVMSPGASYTWISSTHFPTTYGNMRGYFTMTNLLTGELIITHITPYISYTVCKALSV